MKTITIYNYQTADGKIFAVEEDAKAHEKTLPRLLRYKHDVNYHVPLDADEEAFYEFGFVSSKEVYIEATGGFMGHEGGWSRDYEDVKLGLVHGTWHKVLEHALENSTFFAYRTNSYIKKLPYEKV